MDAHTLALLEFDKVREILAGYASSASGKRRCRALAPLADAAKAREAVRRVSEMADALAARLYPPLDGLRDVEQTLKRAGLGVLLEIDQLLDLRDFLDLTGRAFDYWMRLGNDYPLLEKLLSTLRDERHVLRTLDQFLDPQGKVRDSASPELTRVRAELAGYAERIQSELAKLLRQPEIRKALRYPQPTMSGDHHVLPVAVNYRHKVIGVVHRTSASGETIYVEPAKVAEISAEMSVLKSAEQREIRKVLRRASDVVQKESAPLLEAFAVLTELDLITAKARYAGEYRMNPPEIVGRAKGAGAVHLPDARHPILEHLFRQPPEAAVPPSPGTDAAPAERQATPKAADGEARQVVPVTVRLGDAFDLLIITGPNTGGKTVALKTVGLLCLMGLSGMHVPAGRGCRVPLLTDVLADIGDEQSIQQDLSTFSAHLTRIGHVLARGGPTTLVLLDELGAGTEPGEGAALGRAILDELRSLGCLAMVTTHLNDLKTYAFQAERTENAAMEFDSETLRPTYRLTVGQFGQSCAVKIAQRLRLPPGLVQRANAYLRRGPATEEMAQLQELRGQAEEARRQAAAAQAEAEAAAAEYRRKAENLKLEEGLSAAVDRARQALRPGDSVRVASMGKTGKVVRVDARRGKAAVTVGAVEWELKLDDLVPVAAAGRA